MSKVSLALIVLFSGIIVVFFVLVLLSLIIKGFSKVTNLYEKKAQNYNLQKNCKTVSYSNVPDEKINPEIIAVISAAVYSFINTGNKKYKITEIKKQSPIDLSWKNAGLIQNTTPFFK